MDNAHLLIALVILFAPGLCSTGCVRKPTVQDAPPTRYVIALRAENISAEIVPIHAGCCSWSGTIPCGNKRCCAKAGCNRRCGW